MKTSSRRAKLIVSSEDLTPTDLTRRVGIEADGTRERGLAVPKSPNAPITKHHHWWIAEEGGYTIGVDTLIEMVAARVDDQAIDRLRYLVEQGQCTVQLSVYVQTPGEPADGSDFYPDGYIGSGFHLSAERIAWLSRLHASFDIDIY